MSLVGALLVGALLTYLLAKVFGRGEDLPSIRTDPYAEQHRAQLEDGEISSGSVENVRFTQSLRGYNQHEVDQYISRIAAKLEDYEQKLVEQGARPAKTVGAVTRPIVPRSEQSRNEARGDRQ
ncbi:DivIVA domain-containing protein [Corynebacterium anserum]|nr:DivIVA domain-containing protein [Corynebacterium anserum]